MAQELADQRANGPTQPAHQGTEAVFGDGADKLVILDQPLDGSRYFFIAIGANVRESIYFCHNVCLACMESRPASAGRENSGRNFTRFYPQGYERRTDVRSCSEKAMAVTRQPPFDNGSASQRVDERGEDVVPQRPLIIR